MSLRRFPHLAAHLEDLTRLSVEESAREPADRAARSGKGAPVRKVPWPGVGVLWMTDPQVRVINELLEAWRETRTPDVSETHLLRVAGVGARRLREVFAGSRAWGEIVVPGAPGCYRLKDAGGAEPDDAA